MTGPRFRGPVPPRLTAPPRRPVNSSTTRHCCRWLRQAARQAPLATAVLAAGVILAAAAVTAGFVLAVVGCAAAYR